MILFGAFLLVPLGIIVCYSFWKVVNYNVVHQWTIGNYTYFLTTGVYRSLLVSTLWMSLLATAITIGLAFPFAYWLVRYVPKRIQRILLVFVIMPFWTSYLLRIYAWTSILGDKGVINRVLQDLGITNHPLGLFLYDRPAVILVLIYLYFPFAALTLYASLERFDWTQLKAAMDLYASPLTALRRILLPQLKPGIATAVIFVFIPVLGEYLTPQLVGGVRGVMVGNAIVNFFADAQYTQGSAGALLIALGILIVLVIFRRNLRVEDFGGSD